METNDSVEVKSEVKSEEYTPLEMPDVVPGAASVDYPEINEFLQKMKIKTGLFGYQKEDVLEKMQQLNSMYMSRAQQMRDQSRGQLKQMKKQQRRILLRFAGIWRRCRKRLSRNA